MQYLKNVNVSLLSCYILFIDKEESDTEIIKKEGLLMVLEQ